MCLYPPAALPMYDDALKVLKELLLMTLGYLGNDKHAQTYPRIYTFCHGSET